jgi:hypothetical protein
VPPPKSQLSASLWLIVVGLLAVTALGFLSNGGSSGGTEAIPYSEFQQDLAQASHHRR